MLSNANPMNSNETSNLIAFYANSDEKKLLIENAPEKKLRELLTAHIGFDAKLYSKESTISQHLEGTNGIFTSALYASKTVGNPFELSCTDMPHVSLNSNYVKLPCSINVIDSALIEIFNKLLEVENLEKILYYADKNELWIVIKDKTVSVAVAIKHIVRQVNKQSTELIVFVLDSAQVDMSEVPKNYFGVAKGYEV